MKKLFTLLIVMLTLISCEQSGINETATPSFTFAEGTNLNSTIGYAGGELTFSFISNCSWTANENEDWINISPNSGNQENQIISISVDENITGEERTSQIIITYGVDSQEIISLTQDANSVFNIDSDGNYIIEADGGVVAVNVTTNLEYDVIIPDDASSWLSVTDTRAVREETLTFTVTKNSSFDERSATVELKGADGEVLQSMRFKQKGEDKVFETDNNGNYIVEAVGGEIEVMVTTNLEYTVEIPDEVREWLSVADTRTVIREETLTFMVTENTSFDERSTAVKLKGANGEVLQSINFRQKAVEKVFETDGEGSYIVEAAGGKVEVKVTTNLEYMVEIPEEAMAWLSIADTRTVIREETLTFIVAENTLFDERSATVELKGADGKVLQSISFKQKEYEGTIEVDEEYIVNAEGGELEVNLSTDIDFTTSIPEEAKSWISIVETRSMRSESLTFDIAINYDVQERSATINLQNAKGNDVASFVIRQKGGDAVLELKNQYSISNMGGNFEVAVTTNLEYEVEISADSTSWLSYVETRALRTDKLIFNATPNEDEAERSGTIKLIGEDNEELQVINIYQRGNIYEFSYKTNDGKPIYPLTTDGFGGEFIENRFDATTSEGRLIFSGAVTTIPIQAFCYCENLTLFDIPDGITTIGDSAFCGCSNLMRITIPHSVIEFGNQAFQECTGELIINSNIPNPSSDSDSSPFGGSKFTKVTIGDSVTTIGSSAFSRCASLTSVTIGDSVTTIGNRAFSNCDSLTSITIPDSVTTIGNYAFDDCNGLENIIIGDGVTIIGAGAFRDCNSLKDTTIGKGVLSIELKAFQGCTGKLSVYCDIPDRKYWEDRASSYTSGFWGADFSEVVIGDNVTTIGKYAFEGLGQLERVTIGNGVTMIGNSAFSECMSLKNITMGKSITSIGGEAFYHCIDIESIIIPENVTSIGANAFRECYSITNIVIPDKVNTIGGSAFQSCSNLTSALIGDGVTSINQWTFKDSGLKTIVIGKSVASIDSEAFFRPYAIYCKALTPPNINGDEMSDLFISTSIYVPTESVRLYKMANAWHDFSENIEGYDFNQTATINYTTTDGNIADVNFYAISNEYNNGIGKVVYYGDGTIIPARAFSDCVNLESVTIPSSVKIIGNNAFYGCSNLINLTIPDSVTTIGEYAFAYCGSLTSVTIPDSVTTIGSKAFWGCDSLTSVYCKATTPPTLGNYVFWRYNHIWNPVKLYCYIYVPAASVEAYKSTTNWNEYADAIVGYDF